MKIQFTVSSRALKTADLLGVGCFEDGAQFKKFFAKPLAGKKFSGKACETFLIPGMSLWSSKSVFLIGLGKKEKLTLETVRRAAARLVSEGKTLQSPMLRLDLDSFSEKFSLEELSGAALEGARLSDYRFDKYKSKTPTLKTIQSLELVSKRGEASKIARALKAAETLVEGVFFTRDLANEPANVMTPQALAKAAREMASKNNLKCTVLGKNEIQKLKMGGIIGVAQGSMHPPQLIILENKVKTSKPPVVLVGKGVTFDTGGISIKPSNDMDKMKFDMCGAAAVIGAMKVIANLKLPVKVIGITPVVENMPGSKAQRPGDIVRCHNGKTVEVLNTDAEGRLILADALSYAARYKPKALIDIATLTGACAAIFGDIATGVMGTDPKLIESIRKAGETTGERVWELPLWDDFYPLIKATYADIQNISKKSSGAITAGMFLKEFTGHTSSWAHLDVAGTAWREGVGPKPLSPIGATGVGVRLFVELVKNHLS
jgi:leucyl aminopeptidase